MSNLPSAEKVVAELRERTAFRFAGDCKCGKCQLVPRELVDRAADLIAHQAARLEEVTELVRFWIADSKAAHEACAATEAALTAAEADNERLKHAGRAVEQWWLDEGMKHFSGAPYAIFALRAALPKKEQTDV